jgi:Fe-S-cluster containining protein
MVNKQEMAAIEEFVIESGIKPLPQGITCPFFQAGSCAIYEVRPFVCRFFGHTPRMQCVKGYNVNVNPKRERKMILEHYRHDRPRYFLHAFCYTDDEVKDIVMQTMGTKQIYTPTAM